MPGEPPPLIAVVGPTAGGKTAVGIELAERLGGEIVSADAVAVYQGLDIGSAKPTVAERERARFHLIDVARPDEDFTLADFERLANAAIAGIRARGRVPILVGGTGLYVRAVTATLTVPNVPPQAAIRKRLWAEVEASGAPALHARLAQVDPPSAAKIQPGDGKRIIRALEVWEVTGQPMSSFHTPEGVHGVPKPNTFVFGLRWEREELYRRIEARVDAMMAAGFLDEVRGLLAAGFGPDRKAMQSLGYRHLLEHLIGGDKPLGDAVEELKRDTRRYAKRQMIWFRADPQVAWLDVTDTHPVPAASSPPDDAPGPMALAAVTDAIITRLSAAATQTHADAEPKEG
jgi:tRNA dimethylallyltransferase